MNKILKIVIMAIIVILLIVIGYLYFPTKANQSNIVTDSCLKINNCCERDSDCQYIWYTGGCYTPEYIHKIDTAPKTKGIESVPYQMPEREGVTCTCENNACVTHG